MADLDVTLIKPGDPGYDEHRLGFQAYRPQQPAAIVAARGSADFAAAVRLARDEGRRVAVQATGHGAGAVDPAAVLIDTSAMRAVAIDPGTRTARVAAGVRWADVIGPAAEYGLAPLSGSSGSVGAVGYLLSGGLPILGRRYGWAAAAIRGFDVVTADGQKRSVAPDDDGLGWALRGGGGSFALVTAVTIGLIPLRTCYGGSLILPGEDAPAVVRGWRDWAAEVPGTVSTSLAVVPFPDSEAVPPSVRGRLGVAIRFAYHSPAESGASLAEAGARLAAPLRALGTPLVDGLRELPWTESDLIHRDPPGPASSVGTNVALNALPDGVVDAGLETLGGDRAPRAAARRAADGAPRAAARRVVEFRRLGGALTDLAGLPVRGDAEWTAGTVSVLTDPAQAGPAQEFDARFRAAVKDNEIGRIASFLFGEGADPDAVRSAYSPDAWARLRQIKAAADPDGILLASTPIPAA